MLQSITSLRFNAFNNIKIDDRLINRLKYFKSMDFVPTDFVSLLKPLCALLFKKPKL